MQKSCIWKQLRLKPICEHEHFNYSLLLASIDSLGSIPDMYEHQRLSPDCADEQARLIIAVRIRVRNV